jgi:hypothetical protein
MLDQVIGIFQVSDLRVLPHWQPPILAVTGA